MTLRQLFLATGAAGLTVYAYRSMHAARAGHAGQPAVQDPQPASPPADDADDAPRLRALEAGMPSDMHADADNARPGFADFARGA